MLEILQKICNACKIIIPLLIIGYGILTKNIELMVLALILDELYTINDRK